MAGNKTYHWFWAEWFWFPHRNGKGWDDLRNQPGSDVYYPQLEDIHWAIVLGIVLIAARFLLDRIVFVPLATKLGVPTKPKPTIKPNFLLEGAFKNHKTHDQPTIKGLIKQTDLTQRQIEVWFRKRKAQDAPTPMQKFKECCYTLVFYQTLFIYGMVILWQKPYFWKTFLCWRNWPLQHVGDDMYWYYLIELGFYWSLLFAYFSDHRRKDFVEMTVHHFATITLMYFSWLMNFVRVGTLVLVVHDAADSWLCLAKMSIYLKKKTATDVFFGIFVLVWIVTRLFIYPIVILNCTTFEPYYEVIHETFGSHVFFNFFLYVLQVLHLLWTYMIFRIIYRKMMRGDVEDVRSDSEDSDNDAAYIDDDEDEKIASNGAIPDSQTAENTYAISNGDADIKANAPSNGEVHKRHKANGVEATENGCVTGTTTTVNGASPSALQDNGISTATMNIKAASPSRIPKIRKTT